MATCATGPIQPDRNAYCRKNAAATAMAAAHDLNDFLAGEVAKRPDRYAGFASVALQDPAAAAIRVGGVRHDVKLTRLVLAERCQRFEASADFDRGRRIVALANAIQAFGSYAVVPEQIDAPERRDRRPPVDVAARDRDAFALTAQRADVRARASTTGPGCRRRSPAQARSTSDRDSSERHRRRGRRRTS